MGSEWPIVRLANHCLKIGSGATPKGGSGVYLDKGEIYLIRSQNVYNDGFSPDGLVFITDDAADKLKNVVVEKNDILLNITGDSVARVCLAVAEYLPARVNQHVAIIRPNPKDFDSRFLRYFLASPYQQALLLNLASAGATRNALTKAMIEDFEVPKPPIEVQIAIADQLEGYDSKIHLNRQLNQTLEHMAQALFKSWFVDFDPVIDNALAAGNAIPDDLQDRAERRQQQLTKADHKPLPENIRELFPSEFELTESLGWVPKGWVEGSIADLCAVKAGYAYKGDDFTTEGWPVIKIKNITSSKTVDTDDVQYIPSSIAEKTKDFWLDDGDLLMAMTGATVGKFGLLTKNSETPYLLNQRVAKFNPNEKSANEPWFIYCHLSRQEVFDLIVNTASGSAQPNISSGEISSTPCVIPDSALISFFTEEVNVSFAKILKSRKEINTLTNLRDTLLPKLISGELRIPEAQGLVEEVLG